MLPEEVTTITDRYLELADDRIRALWVTGSLTLGDWQPGVSDLDLVAVLDGQTDRATLGRVHTALSAEHPDPPVEVLYLQDGDLARPPARVGARLHHRNGLFHEDSKMVSPVIWHSLAEHGIPVRVPDPEPEIHLDDPALREWCRANLADYWADWAVRGANPATRTGMVLLTDWGVAWCVLGVLRLRYTIETGAITSKSGAGRWGLVAYGGGDGELIEQALACRAAAEPLPPADREEAIARRERVVAFLRRALAD